MGSGGGGGGGGVGGGGNREYLGRFYVLKKIALV